MAGALLAFAANWLAAKLTRHASAPLGLELTRNYFPETKAPVPLAPSTNNPPPNVSPGQTNSALELLAARLHALGLRLADSNQVLRLFHDPRCEQNLVVFIDARDSEQYQQGHIPGAYLFNHYHPENYFPSVLPVCQLAQDIVVYCHGGDCEDSEFAATMLHDAGITNNLFVYSGGISEWSTNGLPVEIGERKSGQMQDPQK
jgi:rhodanese-related sulfurtransferase